MTPRDVFSKKAPNQFLLQFSCLVPPVLPLQRCRTWSEIPRVSRQLEQRGNVKASKCNWESTKPCQGVRLAEKPMNIVMKKTSENKPDGFVLFKWSSGIMRVQFHNCGKSTQGRKKKKKSLNKAQRSTPSNPLQANYLQSFLPVRPGRREGNSLKVTMGQRLERKILIHVHRKLLCCWGVNAIM